MFGLTEVSEGQLPPNLEAANAIDLLQEMASDRFAPAIIDNEHALSRGGHFLLALAQQYYDEPRLMTDSRSRRFPLGQGVHKGGHCR
jgi:hypothetical protein